MLYVTDNISVLTTSRQFSQGRTWITLHFHIRFQLFKFHYISIIQGIKINSLEQVLFYLCFTLKSTERVRQVLRYASILLYIFKLYLRKFLIAIFNCSLLFSFINTNPFSFIICIIEFSGTCVLQFKKNVQLYRSLNYLHIILRKCEQQNSKKLNLYTGHSLYLFGYFHLLYTYESNK